MPRVFALLAVNCSWLVAVPFANATCNVGDFHARSVGSLSQVQLEAYLSVASDEQRENVKKDLGASGKYSQYEGAFDSHNTDESLQKRVRIEDSKKFRSFRKSWAESALNERGLEGYIACLDHEGGFHVVVSTLGSSSNELVVRWSANGASLVSVPRIILPNNIANPKDIQKVFGNQPWRNVNHHHEVLVKRINPQQEAYFSIVIAPEQTELFYIPPPDIPLPPVKMETRRKSWSNAVTRIFEQVPPDARGRMMHIDVDAAARSKRGGEIWIEVYLAAAPNGPKQQQCASERVSGTGNFAIKFPCDIDIPLDAENIEIDAQNTSAAPNGVRAVVTYRVPRPL